MKRPLPPLLLMLPLVRAAALRGVSPQQHAAEYAPRPAAGGVQQGEVFRCLDGAEEHPYERLNDEYCDCADGSDEPGTSACAGIARQRFFCPQRGFASTLLPSSRVNDGICDCCDGADEWAREGAPCPSTCAELAAKHNAQNQVRAAAVRQGIEARHALAGAGAAKRAGAPRNLEQSGTPAHHSVVKI